MAPTKRNSKKLLFCSPVLLPGLHTVAAAQNVTNWASWVIPTEYPNKLTIKAGNTYTTGTTGSVVDPVTGDLTELIWSGEILNTSRDGFLYWGDPTYSASPVSPTPLRGADMLGASGYTLAQYRAHTLAFSQPVTNAVMPIWSLGRSGTTGELTFSQPFVVLSSNNRFTTAGDGTSGYKISGQEASGLIQFQGTYDTISWVITDSEISHGMTVGLTTPDNPLAGTVVPVSE